jgi:hypothetical protein
MPGGTRRSGMHFSFAKRVASFTVANEGGTNDEESRAAELPPYLDEREQQMNNDYEWCLHDPEVRKKYGGKVVVAYKRKILGVEENHAAAWAAAKRKRGCPPGGYAAVAVVPHYIPNMDSH